MLKHICKIEFIIVGVIMLLGVGHSAHALDSELIGLLTENLGVTNQQAESGAGAIYKAAAQNMEVGDFVKVTDALPEVPALMNAVPESDSGALGGLSSTLGKVGGNVSTITGLTNTFSKLGLSADMVQKFIPIVLDYSKSKGGDAIGKLLQKALL